MLPQSLMNYSGLIGAIANAGDVNNSGFHDLLVSAPSRADELGIAVPAGIYYGRENLPQTAPDVYINFVNPGSLGIGGTITGLGDINGDGIDDFALVNINEGINEDVTEFSVFGGGRVHIFYGKDMITGGPDLSSADLTLRPDSTSMRAGNAMFLFGFNEIAKGNFNGDGNIDLGIKPFYHSLQGDLNQGVAGIHIFENENILAGETQPQQMLPLKNDIHRPFFDTTEPYVGFNGRALMAGIRDFTANGHDELLVIPGSGMTNAVLFYGTDESDMEPGIVFRAPNQRVAMGSPGNFINRQYSAAVGDFNGDGFRNFLVVQRGDARFRDTPVYLYQLGEMSVSNEPVTSLPSTYTLEQNYPNPFNPSTVISFSLPAAHDVRLDVFDVLGRRVATLVNSRMQAGQHDISFDASRLASGVYVYRLSAGNFVQSKRLTLIK